MFSIRVHWTALMYCADHLGFQSLSKCLFHTDKTYFLIASKPDAFFWSLLLRVFCQVKINKFIINRTWNLRHLFARFVSAEFHHPLPPFKYFTISKFDRSDRNKMQFLRIIAIEKFKGKGFQMFPVLARLCLLHQIINTYKGVEIHF